MSGKTLAQGLMAASGEQLRFIYVLVMETGIFSMIANKTKDFFEKNVDHSQEQLNQAIAKLNHISDNTLRLKLFLHMTKEFELAGSHYNTSHDIEKKCSEILHKAHAYQLNKEKKYREFVSRNPDLPIESQLTLFQMQKVFESIGSEINNLTAEQQDNFADQIESFINSLPNEQQKKIKEKLNIDSITNSTIKKVIATQGSAVLLAVIVEIAGFAAYTTLTSLIAGAASLIGLTLPFGVYMTATSALSILTGPVGLIVMGGISGAMMLTQSKKVKKMLLQIGIVQLMLPILLDDSNIYDYDSFIEEWLKHYNEQNRLLDMITHDENEYSNMQKQLATIKENIKRCSNDIFKYNIYYNLIIDQLMNNLNDVNEDEMSDSFKERNKEIRRLHSKIQYNKDRIADNKQKSSILDKFSGFFSNLSYENEIKGYKTKIEHLKREQANEVISICPDNFREECHEANQLVQKIDVNNQRLSKLYDEKSILEIKQSNINAKLQQQRQKLRSLQNEIYGIGDLV